VSTLLARRGAGISQGIGVGGRDLTREVGGIMMLEGLRSLQQDAATEVIVLISKPPDAAVTSSILEQVSTESKPTVVCFLGGDPLTISAVPHAIAARTLQESALLALEAAHTAIGDVTGILRSEQHRLAKQAAALGVKLTRGQRSLRGLFSGGTLCYEAQVVWKDMSIQPIRSNAPLPGGPALDDPMQSQGHSAVDLGEEAFTSGRLHPMIDQDLRNRRLLEEARDPEVAAIMLDVVLGYAAHPDPASELGPALEQAREWARGASRDLCVVASVIGTEEDPQCRSRVVSSLERAGAIVCDSNASAARLAGLLVSDRPE
jgi:FdrA protein